MTLSVIGPGFGRTGTMSLKLALEQLGFGPCHHMEEVFRNPPQVAYWQAIANRQLLDWPTVFAGYRSQVDWPGAHVWRDLAIRYPDAKVVLSVRPEDVWWASFSGTIGALAGCYRNEPLPPHVMDMMGPAFSMIVEQGFGCPATDQEGVLAAYRRRVQNVRATVPPERLLVFDVREGWAPLCAFLGVPVPDAPFPHANSTEEFWNLVRGVPPSPAQARAAL